jgi:hypothetical protein
MLNLLSQVACQEGSAGSMPWSKTLENHAITIMKQSVSHQPGADAVKVVQSSAEIRTNKKPAGFGRRVFGKIETDQARSKIQAMP